MIVLYNVVWIGWDLSMLNVEGVESREGQMMKGRDSDDDDDTTRRDRRMMATTTTTTFHDRNSGISLKHNKVSFSFPISYRPSSSSCSTRD